MAALRPVCAAAMLTAELPELGRMTSGEAAAMTGLAPVPHDSGAMRGRRTIAGGRRSLRHVLFQAALAAACPTQFSGQSPSASKSAGSHTN
ncbi:IS110 family transposase [Paracoccus jeotgali]|uniref:IS110 family transposase n=1 Tax=Paracoccus jeotgali TaxID=2065379 RepID=UPI001CEF865F|nr:IS110 family transposase [Paracoccus jeotgali]